MTSSGSVSVGMRGKVQYYFPTGRYYVFEFCVLGHVWILESVGNVQVEQRKVDQIFGEGIRNDDGQGIGRVASVQFKHEI